MTLYTHYRKNKPKYAEGGSMDPTAIVQMIQQLGTGIVDAVDKPDEFSGVQSALGSGIKGSLQGGSIGAALALINNTKQRKENMEALETGIRNTRLSENSRSAAAYATNPELLKGYKNAGYFAEGGDIKSPLAQLYMKGGYAKSLSSDGAEIVGKSHEVGGVQIPEAGAEVEGGETAKGSYIFSDKLGFAGIHKKIAKAKGIIEKKPMTAERLTSVKRLEEREGQLMLMQELLKRKMN